MTLTLQSCLYGEEFLFGDDTVWLCVENKGCTQFGERGSTPVKLGDW